MFHISLKPQRPRKHLHDLYAEAAQLLADTQLRDRVTMPCHPDGRTQPWVSVGTGGRLPPVSCAFLKCAWHGGGAVSERALRDDPEHPWDQELRGHVLRQHATPLATILRDTLKTSYDETLTWDVYKLALSIKEQGNVPIAGPSLDRRSFEHTVQVYNDSTIRISHVFLLSSDQGRYWSVQKPN